MWSTYLGGNETEFGYSLVVDNVGNCIVTGRTTSHNFPILNAFIDTLCGGGSSDAYLSKFSSDGDLIWSTFYGGSQHESCNSIAISDDGSCFITGYTSSSDLPLLNAFDSSFNGFTDIYTSKFDLNGQLIWGTYLGGTSEEYCEGISTDSEGNCYITGYTNSDDFPTMNCYDNTYNNFEDVFICKFTSLGTLLMSTYLGGYKTDIGYGVSVDMNGNCYITGVVFSEDFPTVNAYDGSFNGGMKDAFVTKILRALFNPKNS